MRKVFLFAALAAMVSAPVVSQELSNFNFGGRQQVVSPELKGDKVTFRLNANYATVVNLAGN